MLLVPLLSLITKLLANEPELVWNNIGEVPRFGLVPLKSISIGICVLTLNLFFQFEMD